MLHQQCSGEMVSPDSMSRCFVRRLAQGQKSIATEVHPSISDGGLHALPRGCAMKTPPTCRAACSHLTTHA